MADGLINWRLSDARGARAQIQAMIAQTQDAGPAFDKMLDVIAERQVEWFDTEGEAGGNKKWAPRRGKYAEMMARRYPNRKILHGPDTKGHTGGQLRDQLTRRPFGRERISPRGFSMGTDLPYSIYHQQGDGLPRRRPLRPMDQETVSKFKRILSLHIVANKRNRYGSFQSSGAMLSKGKKGRR